MTEPERTDTAFLALDRAHKDACSHNHIYGACLGPTRRLALGKQYSFGFDFQKVVKLARFRDHSENDPMMAAGARRRLDLRESEFVDHQ